MSEPQEQLALVEASEEHLRAFLDYAAEYAVQADEWTKAKLQTAVGDPAAYLRQCHDWARGVRLPVGLVPETTYWLVRDGRDVVATSSIRHRLNEHLEHEAGHIGYGVRPCERRKGYGAAVCRLTIEKARAMGLRRVLITCDTDNVASVRIIETNGGRFENQVRSRITGKMKSRYWIDL